MSSLKFKLKMPPEEFSSRGSENELLYSAMGNLSPFGDWICYENLCQKEIDRIRGLVVGGGKNSRLFKKALRAISERNLKFSTRTTKNGDGTRDLWIGVVQKNATVADF